LKSVNLLQVPVLYTACLQQKKMWSLQFS